MALCIALKRQIGLPLYRDNVFIEATTSIAHVAKIAEYEGFVDIKAACNDVFAVLSCKPLRLFDVKTPVEDCMH